MPQFATNVIGNTIAWGYSILAAAEGCFPWAEGITIDWSTITAETVSRTLPSGYVTTIGEKVIPAGSVFYALATGTQNSKYGVAVTATTLVAGETCVGIRDFSYQLDLDHVGDVTARAQVRLPRLLVGGAAASLANLRAACPGLEIRNI